MPGGGGEGGPTEYLECRARLARCTRGGNSQGPACLPTAVLHTECSPMAEVLVLSASIFWERRATLSRSGYAAVMRIVLFKATAM